MGDCSDQLSVLKDWTSAHALDDAAGLFKKILILHPDHHAFVYIAVAQVDFSISTVYSFTLPSIEQ